jgi:hypothetical protein
MRNRATAAAVVAVVCCFDDYLARWFSLSLSLFRIRIVAACLA